MKKILIGVLALFSASTFAQQSTHSSRNLFEGTRFGATGGLNYSRIKNAHNPSGARYTFQVGVLAEIPLTDDEQFFLQPEVVYYGAGESGKDKNVYLKEGQTLDQVGYNAQYVNNYISVPIQLKMFFSESETEFFALLGPRFNFLINQKVENGPASRPWYAIEGDGVNTGVNGKATGFNMAIAGGVGFSYKRQLEIVGKFDFGLFNVYKGLMKEPGIDPAINKPKKEHVLSVGINYIFD